MPNFSFVPLEGTIQNIRPFGDECCSSLVTLQTSEGTVTVVVSSDTYVISEVRLRRGMTSSRTGNRSGCNYIHPP